MASTPEEICNLAISWLSGNPIGSLADLSAEAVLCNSNYNLSRRAVLEEKEWTFAIRRAQLIANGNTPISGYGNEFDIPADLIYSISVTAPFSSSNRPRQISHVFEGNNILADIETIDIKYIYDLTDTTRFSSLFDQTLAAHIGMNIAVPLTEDINNQERLGALYLRNLDAAAASNGMQGSREKLDISIMEQSRRLFTDTEYS